MTSITSIIPNLAQITQGFNQLSTMANTPSASPAQFQSLLSQLQAEMSSTSSTSPIATAASSANMSGSSYASTATTTPVPYTAPSSSTTTPVPYTAPSTNPAGDQIANDALGYLGVPYTYGGTSVQTGFDCSGLVQKVYQDMGIALPRTAAEQQQVGTPVTSIAQAQPGDLVFYGQPADHVGIYVGNGLMVNAPHTGTTVSVVGVGTPTSIMRVIPPSSTSTSQATSSVALTPVFAAATSYYGLPAGLLQAVSKVESNFNPNAVSPAGAVGIMQIMPQTAAGLGINPTDPVQSIFGAAKLLSEKLTHFGSVPLALAAYNAGDGAVEAAKGIPPYQETQNYISKVISTWQGGTQ